MRQLHYQFAHQTMKDEAFRRPDELWDELGQYGRSSVFGLWEQMKTASGDTNDIPHEELDVGFFGQTGSVHIVIVKLPAPAFPTEAYYIALCRNLYFPHSMRYFVLERDAEGAACWSEYRGSMRVRGDTVNVVSPEAFIAAIQPALDDVSTWAETTPLPRRASTTPPPRPVSTVPPPPARVSTVPPPRSVSTTPPPPAPLRTTPPTARVSTVPPLAAPVSYDLGQEQLDVSELGDDDPTIRRESLFADGRGFEEHVLRAADFNSTGFGFAEQAQMSTNIIVTVILCLVCPPIALLMLLTGFSERALRRQHVSTPYLYVFLPLGVMALIIGLVPHLFTMASGLELQLLHVILAGAITFVGLIATSIWAWFKMSRVGAALILVLFGVVPAIWTLSRLVPMVFA